MNIRKPLDVLIFIGWMAAVLMAIPMVIDAQYISAVITILLSTVVGVLIGYFDYIIMPAADRMSDILDSISYRQVSKKARYALVSEDIRV